MRVGRNALLFLALVVGLLAASAVVIAVRPTVLGLDLQGGVEVVLQGKPTPQSEVTDSAIERSIEIIRKRVDAFGVAEPEIQRQGDDQISVSLPGAKDPRAVVDDLIRPAQLAFYDFEGNRVPLNPEDPDAGSPDLFGVLQVAKAVKPDDTVNKKPTYYLFQKALDADGRHRPVGTPETDQKDLLDPYEGGKLPANLIMETLKPGLVVISNEEELFPGRDNSPKRTVYYLLQDRVGLTGNDVTNSQAILDTGRGSSQTVVSLEFTGDGGRKFAQVTRELARRGASLAAANPGVPHGQLFQTFAIALDGKIVSRASIDFDQYPDGLRDRAQIEGQFSQSQARRLAQQINSGAIPIILDPISQKQVSATLGKQSLRQGLIAGTIGLALVMVFLVGYYRVLGLVADLALLIYGVLFYAMIELVPITLTLPGIAGMILTIGVAADANVVIFERVREEARAGRSARTAVLNGYAKGISAIIDANVVTLATAAILFLFATAGVKGFAFTLFIGVLLSLFTAVLATRAVFGVLAGTKLFKNERAMGLHQREIRWKMDFVGKWKLWMAISFVPLAIGAVVVGINGFNLGLDFESGTRITATFTGQQPSEDQVRQIVATTGYPDAKIQVTTEELQRNGRTETVRGFQIQTETLSPAQQTVLERNLERDIGNFEVTAAETVGPVFGAQIIRNAIYAIILSFLVIIAYLSFRFEYKLALPALLSVVHDVWLTLSIYSFTGREITSATVAALLTILGYSLYDVVIVFDRIRENVPKLRSLPYRQVVNRSIHETLTRSIITSVTTVVPVAVLLVFGGDTLKDFAFALLVGILSGGVSSIAIAAPIAALWKEREPESRRREARIRKKQMRVSTADSDVVDVEVLARAERALDAQIDPRTGDLYEPSLLADGAASEEPEEEEPEPERRPTQVATEPDAATEPAPAPDGAPPDGAPGTDRPDRVRRHRQVQRRRRR